MKNRRRFILIAAMISLISLALVGGTLAYLMAYTDPAVNEFTPGDIDVEIEENFPPPTDSQTTAQKQVRIKNTGKIDAFIRATIVPTFRQDGKSLAGAVDYSGVNSGVINVTAPDGETVITLNLASGWNGKWFYANGVFYYRDAVPPTGYTSYLLDSVTRSGGDDWQGLEVEVLCDAVQAGGTVADAIQNWDCTYNESTNTIGP